MWECYAKSHANAILEEIVISIVGPRCFSNSIFQSFIYLKHLGCAKRVGFRKHIEVGNLIEVACLG